MVVCHFILLFVVISMNKIGHWEDIMKLMANADAVDFLNPFATKTNLLICILHHSAQGSIRNMFLSGLRNYISHLQFDTNVYYFIGRIR